MVLELSFETKKLAFVKASGPENLAFGKATGPEMSAFGKVSDHSFLDQIILLWGRLLDQKSQL